MESKNTIKKCWCGGVAEIERLKMGIKSKKKIKDLPEFERSREKALLISEKQGLYLKHFRC